MIALRRTGVCLLGLGLCVASPALAQLAPLSERAYASLNVGFQPTSINVSQAAALPVYDENAILAGTQEVTTGILVDVNGAFPLRPRFFVGGAMSFTRGYEPATIAGSIPHPIYTDQPRSVTFDTSDLKHAEQVFHLFAAWRFPVNERLDAGIFGGPSFFWSQQDFPETVTVTEVGPPYTSVNVNLEFGEFKDTSYGFHFGGDVTYLLTDSIGATGFLRYALATAKYEVPGIEPVEVDLGGLQVAAGIRILF